MTSRASLNLRHVGRLAPLLPLLTITTTGIGISYNSFSILSAHIRWRRRSLGRRLKIAVAFSQPEGTLGILSNGFGSHPKGGEPPAGRPARPGGRGRLVHRRRGPPSVGQRRGGRVWAGRDRCRRRAARQVLADRNCCDGPESKRPEGR